MWTMHQPVGNGICNIRIADLFMPEVNRQLAVILKNKVDLTGFPGEHFIGFRLRIILFLPMMLYALPASRESIERITEFLLYINK